PASPANGQGVLPETRRALSGVGFHRNLHRSLQTHVAGKPPGADTQSGVTNHMKMRLIEKRRESEDDTMSFIFYHDGRLAWRAGQFMHYTLPHEGADDRHEDRYFTIASAPQETNVRLTTRFGGQAASSTFKKALLNLPFGATVEADAPDGDFVLDDADSPAVFIAGGIGITPFRAMLVDLDRRKVDIKVTLLYSSRSSVLFQRQLDVLASKHPQFKIQYFISPNHVDDDALREVVAPSPQATFYVSGPEQMVDTICKTLTSLGISKDRLKQDRFPGYEAS